MKKLNKSDKYFLYSRLIEILVLNQVNFDEYLFTPISKIDFKKVITAIDFYEDKFEVEKEDKLLNNHPAFKTYLYL